MRQTDGLSLYCSVQPMDWNLGIGDTLGIGSEKVVSVHPYFGANEIYLRRPPG